jgi:hypothetical protein
MNYSDLWKRYVRLNEVDVSPTPSNPPAGTSPAASPSTNQNQMRTYGDLQKIIQKVDRDKTLKVVGDQVKDALIDQLAGLIPGASNIKDAFGFFKSIYDSKDTQKTNTWLDKLNIDDNYTMIVDDTIENAFLKELSQMISRENPQTQLPADFNINKKLEDWLKQKYGNRTLAGGMQEGKSKRAKVGKKSGGDRCTRIAKRKYDVWPSAYASGAVVRCRQGKIWKGVSESATDEEIDIFLLLEKSDPKVGTGKKPKDSDRRLYTDENPKDTVSVKFSTVQDIKDTLSKESFKSKSHARQSQIINLIHQRVRVAYDRAKEPEVKSRLKKALDYAEQRKEASKEKTKNLQEEQNNLLNERCWKGYTQKGMKTMFGKRYPNCVKIKKEQIELEEVEIIEEEWSDKYKRSIDCKNPKGFSQKAHCQGKKKK